MSFCRNCGTEIPIGALFCPKCGTPVGNTSNGKAPEENPDRTDTIGEKTGKQHHKAPIKLIVILICCAAAVVAGLLLYFLLPTRIDLNKYTTIKYDGYNTIGTASCEVDYDKLEQDYADKIHINKKAFSKELEDEGLPLDGTDLSDSGEEIFKDLMVGTLEDDIRVKVTPAKNLSNNDTIKLKWDIDEKSLKQYEKLLHINVVYKDKTEKVKNLPDVATKDVFSEVNVTFEGITGEGEAKYEYTGSDPLKFSFNSDSSLKNGGKVTLSIDGADDIQSFVDTYGYAPKETSRTYQVTGLADYITKLSDIDSKIQKQLTDNAIESVQKYIKNRYNTSTSVTGFTYFGSYLLTPQHGDGNTLYVVISGTMENQSAGVTGTTVYYPVEYTDVASSKTKVYSHNNSIQGYTYDTSLGDGHLYIATNGYTDGTKMYQELISGTDDKVEMTEGLKQFGS